MSLFGGSVTGCQATDNIGEHNFWEHNLLRGCGLAFLLALLSWVSVTGCAGVASSSPAPGGGKGQLSISASTVPFGNVNTGSASTRTITLTNAGTASLTVSQVSVSGPGFSISGLTFPLTLATAGQSSTLTAKFAPTVAGNASGTISLLSNGSNSPTLVALTGTGMGATTAPQLTVIPTSANFAVNVGSSQSQPVTITNTGTATLSITQANVSGSGFSVSGLALPLNLPSGQSSSFKVNFAPTVAGSVTGGVSLVSNSVNSPTQIALAANGVQPTPASVTGVTISPTNPSVQTGHTVQFAATVQGTATDKSVKWTASAGSINANGLFTAPSAAATVTVTATSNADTSKQASVTVTVTAPVASGGPLPAFPGAEGGGATSVGGRGGTVCEVTNLNDSGPNSLRDCLTRSGPRTVVFRVGGYIHLLSGIYITNPYITIAGQTAPGGGITIAGDQMNTDSMIYIITHDVTVRYIRQRIGVGPGHSGGPSAGVVGFFIGNDDVYNVILDHISQSWSDNKPIILYSNYGPGVHNFTNQWSMQNEGMAAVPNSIRSGSQATCSGSGVNSADPNFVLTNEHDDDWHHNFWSNCTHRLPETGQYTMNWVNNIIYNWSYATSDMYYGPSFFDVIGNKYKAGPATSPGECYTTVYGPFCAGPARPYSFRFFAGPAPYTGNLSIYLSGNQTPEVTDPVNGDQYAAATMITCYQCNAAGPVPQSWRRSTPQPPQKFPITINPVTTLESLLFAANGVGDSQKLSDTACDGTFVPNRDAVDTRLINEYNQGIGIIPGSQVDVGGYPNLVSPGTACVSSLHDGIADNWKAKYSLSLTDPTLYQKAAVNGYTYLENYLNGTDPNVTAGINSTKSTWVASLSTPMRRALNIRLPETTKKREISLLPWPSISDTGRTGTRQP
jgi:pectate lyase